LPSDFALIAARTADALEATLLENLDAPQRRQIRAAAAVLRRASSVITALPGHLTADSADLRTALAALRSPVPGLDVGVRLCAIPDDGSHVENRALEELLAEVVDALPDEVLLANRALPELLIRRLRRQLVFRPPTLELRPRPTAVAPPGGAT
jgi:hypothetical protein